MATVKTTVRYLNIICVGKSRVQQFLPQTHDGVTCFTNWLHLVTWSIAKTRNGNNKIWSTDIIHFLFMREKSLVIELQAVVPGAHTTRTRTAANSCITLGSGHSCSDLFAWYVYASKLWSSQLWTQFKKLRREAWKSWYVYLCFI